MQTRKIAFADVYSLRSVVVNERVVLFFVSRFYKKKIIVSVSYAIKMLVIIIEMPRVSRT